RFSIEPACHCKERWRRSSRLREREGRGLWIASRSYHPAGTSGRTRWLAMTKPDFTGNNPALTLEPCHDFHVRRIAELIDRRHADEPKSRADQRRRIARKGRRVA